METICPAFPGYLTLIQRDENTALLSFPNREVRDSLLRHMLSSYAKLPITQASPSVARLWRALAKGDTDGFIEMLDALFAKIPAEIFIPRAGAYYHSITFIALQILGYFTQSEVRHRRGRTDAVVETHDRIFVMEFKVDKPAAEAIRQIREMRYADLYKDSSKTVVLLGISFHSDKKGVGDWVEERV